MQREEDDLEQTQVDKLIRLNLSNTTCLYGHRFCFLIWILIFSAISLSTSASFYYLHVLTFKSYYFKHHSTKINSLLLIFYIMRNKCHTLLVLQIYLVPHCSVFALWKCLYTVSQNNFKLPKCTVNKPCEEDSANESLNYDEYITCFIILCLEHLQHAYL